MDRREGTSQDKPELKHAAGKLGRWGLMATVCRFSALTPWAISPASRLAKSWEFVDFS